MCMYINCTCKPALHACMHARSGMYVYMYAYMYSYACSYIAYMLMHNDCMHAYNSVNAGCNDRLDWLEDYN